jgi:hypothetical protein
MTNAHLESPLKVFYSIGKHYDLMARKRFAIINGGGLDGPMDFRNRQCLFVR